MESGAGTRGRLRAARDSHSCLKLVGEKDPDLLGTGLTALRCDRVADGHVARDAARGTIHDERDHAVAARIIGDQRVAAEVGQSSGP